MAMRLDNVSPRFRPGTASSQVLNDHSFVIQMPLHLPSLASNEQMAIRLTHITICALMNIERPQVVRHSKVCPYLSTAVPFFTLIFSLPMMPRTKYNFNLDSDNVNIFITFFLESYLCEHTQIWRSTHIQRDNRLKQLYDDVADQLLAHFVFMKNAEPDEGEAIESWLKVWIRLAVYILFFADCFSFG
jgi:hypothetical protein